MKKIACAILVLSAFYITAGIAQKKLKKAEYVHDFPKEMSPEVKDAYIKLFDKGKILYQINCAQCHDTTIKGVVVMPEFTKEHLAKYELRVQNPKHEESLSEMRVNAEELQQIMIFLSYYKKVGILPIGRKI